MGSTAVGKSSVGLRLAKEFDGEIIGADSMQVYKGFDIGTGKLTAAECDGVVHKLIDVVDGDSEFSVGEYVKLAAAEIEKTAQSGKLPIIVGGTGLYVTSLLNGCNFANAPKDAMLRDTIKALSHFFGAKAVHYLLESVDAPSAQNIAVNDVKRAVRALEIYALRGAPKSTEAATEQNGEYDYLAIVLTLPRDEMYKRIDARVKRMFDDGLVDEVKGLLRNKDCGSMQALGYKQIAASPDAPRAELESLTAQKTRNYAKRQVTYFKNMKLNKIFIDARDYQAVRNAVAEFLEK